MQHSNAFGEPKMLKTKPDTDTAMAIQHLYFPGSTTAPLLPFIFALAQLFIDLEPGLFGGGKGK